MWKILSCLATGCCLVLKPSELAPLSSLFLCDLISEIGVPPGVINVVPGLGIEAGIPLSLHPLVDKISFTGTVSVGRQVMANAASSTPGGPKGVSLALGGKSPIIVFEDTASIDVAVDWIMQGIFTNAGQVCSATSRLIVAKAIREPLLARLLEQTAKIVVGSTIGPLISGSHAEKVWGYINEAKEQGIPLLYGGEKEMVDQAIKESGGGFFVPPTIFVDVPTDSRIWQEEIFGIFTHTHTHTHTQTHSYTTIPLFHTHPLTHTYTYTQRPRAVYSKLRG